MWDSFVPSQPPLQSGTHCLSLVSGRRKGRGQLRQVKGHVHITIVTLLKGGSSPGDHHCFCAFFLQALVGIALGSGGPCWVLQWRGCRGTEEMKDPRGKHPKEQTMLYSFLYLTPSHLKSHPSYAKGRSLEASYSLCQACSPMCPHTHLRSPS